MNRKTNHVFIFIRTDISLNQQIIQSNHVTLKMAFHLSECTDIPSIVLIGIPDKVALKAVIERLPRYGIGYEAFYEPDDNMGLSAVATYPITKNKQRHALGVYPLWSSEVCYA